MSHIPERGSLQGLRRRKPGVNPDSNSPSSDETKHIEEADEEEVVVEHPVVDEEEDAMDDIASIELGRKLSASGSEGGHSDGDEEEPRCDEALLQQNSELVIENESELDDQGTEERSEEEPRCDEALLQHHSELNVENGQDEKINKEQISEDTRSLSSSSHDESSDDTAEYKTGSEGSPQHKIAQNRDDSTSNKDNETDDDVNTMDKDDDNTDTPVSGDVDNKEEDDEDGDGVEKVNVVEGKDGDSDEENEIRIPLTVKVITRPRSASGRSSPTNSELDVECVYLPTRMASAAENLRQTAGSFRNQLGEQAGHLREQIGEQAGHLQEQAAHLREQLGEGAEKIAQYGGHMKEQMGVQAQKVVVQADKVVHKVKDLAWRVTHHNLLPEWLKDNDFLHYHHRPALPSFRACFKSIFRIHTETGNIWTHMIGCVTFLIMMIYFLVTSILADEDWEVIVVYMAFFIGAITCLGFSWLFHTCSCHSDKVAKIFSKLDYSGISLLIVGSFIPWLYFGFYCENISRWFYITLIVVLGSICLMVALKDKFASPTYRPIRAGLFIALGLSAVIPAIHFLVLQGVYEAFTRGSFGWMLFMGALYIGGALLYACRIPERFFPGKCDLLVQSHQIFHVMVVAAAFVHYHGLNLMAGYREEIGECIVEELDEVLPYTSATM